MEYLFKSLVITTAYCLFFSFSDCYSQLSDSTIKTIYDNAIKTIELQKIDFHYNDSATYEDFDFGEFKPDIHSKEDRIYYKAFYKDLYLAKLSRFDKSNPSIIYEFYFWDFEKYNIYIVSTFDNRYPEVVLSGIHGFFIYDKKLKSNLFIGIEDQFCDFHECDEKKTVRQPGLIHGSIPDTKIIRAIISLDKSLNPIKRLNFYNNKLLSYSDFHFEDNIFTENLRIYDNPQVEISKLKFWQLGGLMEGELVEGIILRMVVVLSNKSRETIWADPFRGYIQSTFQFNKELHHR